MAYGAAQTANELLKMEELMKSKEEFLTKKENGEIVDNFRIGE